FDQEQRAELRRRDVRLAHSPAEVLEHRDMGETQVVSQEPRQEPHVEPAGTPRARLLTHRVAHVKRDLRSSGIATPLSPSPLRATNTRTSRPSIATVSPIHTVWLTTKLLLRHSAMRDSTWMVLSHASGALKLAPTSTSGQPTMP